MSTYNFRPVVMRLEELGWGQAKLERHIGASPGMATRWKKGQRIPNDKFRQKLNDFLADETLDQVFDLNDLERRVRMLPELERRPAGTKQPVRKTLEIDVLSRNPRVHRWTLQRANGLCEFCRGPAPFERPSGEAFLEVHHVTRLADGGEDTVDNTVALCPNCHRKAHYGEAKKVQGELRRIVGRRRGAD